MREMNRREAIGTLAAITAAVATGAILEGCAQNSYGDTLQEGGDRGEILSTVDLQALPKRDDGSINLDKYDNGTPITVVGFDVTKTATVKKTFLGGFGPVTLDTQVYRLTSRQDSSIWFTGYEREHYAFPSQKDSYANLAVTGNVENEIDASGIATGKIIFEIIGPAKV